MINAVTNTAVSISNPAVLPEGKYFVRVKDDANCSLDSDPIDIKRKPQPKITNTLSPIPAACGQINGAVKGIMISDATGKVTYKWYRNDPITGAVGTDIIATTLILENVESGRYTLYVYDEGQC